MRNSLRRCLTLSVLLGASVCGAAVVAKGVATTEIDEARLESLLSQLHFQEKVYLLSGASGFATMPIERLGIRGMHFVDGPNGVRSNDGDEATAFPAGIALASSWNPQLTQQVGAAIGEETRSMGGHVLLGPNLNLVRSPLAGRNFETYGEDPLLAGKLGVGFVRGVQSVGVAVSAKHFVGNEQETERNRGSSNIDARALNELYLAPFERVVREAQPWTVMTAYNRLNGIYMSEHQPLVRQTLKQRWGFDGVVMSDWGGTHSTYAVATGLDLEMPGPAHHFGDALLTATQLFQVPVTAIDDAARRMLRLSARVGALDADVNGDPKPKGPASTTTHRELARAAAAQGITLLKNHDQVLPLELSKVRKIAVIGPNADAAVIQGGGSAQVLPANIVSPLDAIEALVGNAAAITYEQGVDNERYTPAIDGRDLSPTRERRAQGLAASYYANANFAGKPLKTRVDRTIGAMLMANDVNLLGNNQMSVRWQGYYWPRVTGEHEFEYEHIRVIGGSTLTLPDAVARATLKLDGRALLHAGMTTIYDASSGFFPTAMRRVRVHLVAGRAYPISVDYSGNGYRIQHFRLAVRLPTGSLDAAVQAARSADVAVVFVGSGTTAESEGRDRNGLGLYGEQDALVQAVAAANPRTVVVLNNGGPVAMPWVEQVPAIVEAWLPGQEGALAVADVLFGKTNPSGKLPVSFPKRVQDSPSYLFYPGFRDANYDESVFMGYRYYDKKQVEPLFAFGHGLSYTQFEYSNLRLPASVQSGQRFTVSVDIKNIGRRAGVEVAQLYVADRQCREVCPVRELKGFERVEVPPGETRTITLQLDERALSHYDSYSESWQTTPGKYEVAVGGSSRDLRVRGELTIAQAYSR